MSNSKTRERDFFSQLVLSESSLRNYRVAYNSTLLKDTLESKFGVSRLFEITNLDTLWKLYCMINEHPKNVAAHRAYSAAIMKYIRFLNNGEKYGKRIDYRIPKKRRSTIDKDIAPLT